MHNAIHKLSLGNASPLLLVNAFQKHPPALEEESLYKYIAATTTEAISISFHSSTHYSSSNRKAKNCFTNPS